MKVAVKHIHSESHTQSHETTPPGIPYYTPGLLRRRHAQARRSALLRWPIFQAESDSVLREPAASLRGRGVPSAVRITSHGIHSAARTQDSGWVSVGNG